jgi:hypothetical protein
MTQEPGAQENCDNVHTCQSVTIIQVALVGTLLSGTLIK